jgi:hypothetical protein
MKFLSGLTGLIVFMLSSGSWAMYAGDHKLTANDKNKAETVACQDRMKDFITPNANHGLLKSFEGQWIAKIAFRPTLENPFSYSQAAVDARMVMDGRYLERTLKGNGDNFEARVISGFDNFRRQYTSVWYDNMCTGMITGSGQYDALTKTLTEEGSMSCPMTNQAYRWFKATTRIIDPDRYTYEMFKRDNEGEEFSAMVIDYVRVK